MLKYYITSNKYSVKERQTKGGKVYDVVFRVHTIDGTVKQKNLCGYRTRSAAKQGYLDFVRDECEIVNKSAIAAKKEANTGRNELTIREYTDIYLASLKNQNKESSIHDKYNIYAHTILPMIGDERPSDLTVERLYRWQDDLWSRTSPKGKPYAYRTLTNIRKNLNALLAFISARYGVPNNLPKVKTPRNIQARPEMTIWTREQFDRFLSVVDDPRLRCLFAVLFFTGRRKGEVLALQASDVGADAIRFDKTYSRKTLDGSPYRITAMKNRNSGSSPICAPLRAEIERYGGEAPFFFGGAAPIHENTVAHSFEKYIALSGLPRIRIHDLRHSFVSMLIHLGANYTVVADLIGDDPAQIVQTYGHMYQEDKIAIIARIV